MKRILILLITLVTARYTHAQNVGINATGAAPDASAILDVASTSKGLLVPRVALTATNAAGPITSPATSLLVYNTATAGSAPNNVVPGYYYWNGTTWIIFSTASTTAWTLTGNSGLNPAIHFIGTTDDKPLIFKSFNNSFLEFGNRGTLGLTQGYPDYDNATEKVTYVRSALQFEAAAANFYKPKMYTDVDGNFRIKGSSAGTDFFEFGSTGSSNSGGFEFVIGDDGDEPMVFKSYHYLNGMSEIMRLQSGRMAVGSNSFNATNPEKLLIDAGVTTSYNLMTGKGSIDNYLQINVQNSSATGSASSDVVATANNGNESVNYIDMGINSGSYTNTSLPVLGGANTAYLYATGNDFVIGNGTATKPIRFFTGGFAAANERMRISGTGDVAIGSTTFNATYPEAFLVDAGTTSSVNAIVGRGSINSYLQLNIQNLSSGTSSSSDVVATADNGSETTNYIDMGINGSTNASGVMGGPNDAYLYNIGQDLLIATGTAAKSLIFMTGGTSEATNERMRISGTGNVGVGTNSPNSTLDVNGSTGQEITTTNSNITLNATHSTVILTNGSTPSVTLPAAAASNARRVYVIVNQTNGARTISSYRDFANSGATTITANSSITIQSDGNNWYRIR
ncbi:hypothetical protein KK062_11285 [Fulvivirgaceae bacterium PWU5]|uniref:Uncharacterized protein n=1 Tax=Dawidia cretensis TaxID=2782350 RepID=A0AAP2DZA2_9BACT|nr:hypothetical protein [Dawidia cretensis]MBT1708812.1 hypothetical protein [Dawidia cretensis]